MKYRTIVDVMVEGFCWICGSPWGEPHRVECVPAPQRLSALNAEALERGECACGYPYDAHGCARGC